MKEKLCKFVLSDIRCFEGKQEFNLRPLTFLVGENSTGKSTLLGCIQILGDFLGFNKILSTYHMENLNFNRAPYEMGAFADIVRKGNSNSTQSNSFQLGFEFPNGNEENLKILLHMRERKNGSEPFISTFRIIFQDVEIYWRAAANRKITRPKVASMQPKGNRKVFKIEASNCGSFLRYLELGIYIEDLSQSDSDDKNEDRTALIDVLKKKVFKNESKGNLEHKDGVSHGIITPPHHNYEFKSFAPIRSKPQRTYDPVAEFQDHEGNEMANFLVNLYRSYPKRWKKLKSSLEEFGKSSGLFKEINVRTLSGFVSDPFQIQFKVHDESIVNLIDIGYGVSQILPILVRIFDRETNRTFLMQQPELHLHPRAQAEFVSLLITLYKDVSLSYIIETHSDAMINRARIEIMKGNLSPQDVSLIYCEPSENGVKVHNIEFDDQANMLSVPQGFRNFFLKESNRLLGMED